jgi:hypothetical protein
MRRDLRGRRRSRVEVCLSWLAFLRRGYIQTERNRTEIGESLIAKTMCDSEGEKENVVGTREVTLVLVAFYYVLSGKSRNYLFPRPRTKHKTLSPHPTSHTLRKRKLRCQQAADGREIVTTGQQVLSKQCTCCFLLRSIGQVAELPLSAASNETQNSFPPPPLLRLSATSHTLRKRKLRCQQAADGREIVTTGQQVLSKHKRLARL